MKTIQIIPCSGYNLYGELVKKEVELFKQNRGTFFRSGPKKKNEAKWAHAQYAGWVNLRRGMNNMIIAEIQTRSDSDTEWQIFQAFLGFIDRHFGDYISAINIQMPR